MKFGVLFIVIWGLLAPTSLLAQSDSLVCIKPSTARYFLEVHDKYDILTKKDSLSSQLIINLEAEIDFKDKIINSYQEDSILHLEQTKHLEETLRIYERDSCVQKRNARLTKLGAIIVVVLILVIK